MLHRFKANVKNPSNMAFDALHLRWRQREDVIVLPLWFGQLSRHRADFKDSLTDFRDSEDS